MPLDIPYGTETAGESISIDGRTYRPLLVDSEGRLIVMLPTRSAVRAYRATSDQVIPTGAVTKIQFNAESFDVLGEFDSTTNYRFTAQVAGYYLVIVAAVLSSVAAGVVAVTYIYKNGAEVTRGGGRVTSGDFPALLATDIIHLEIGGYLEGFVYQASGGNLNLNADATTSYISIHQLS